MLHRHAISWTNAAVVVRLHRRQRIGNKQRAAHLSTPLVDLLSRNRMSCLRGARLRVHPGQSNERRSREHTHPNLSSQSHRTAPCCAVNMYSPGARRTTTDRVPPSARADATSLPFCRTSENGKLTFATVPGGIATRTCFAFASTRTRPRGVGSAPRTHCRSAR